MAQELINISLHQSGGGFDIPLKAGIISIPDTPGAYAISSGCGSGKTESIKSLIRHKCAEGILYCVDTIAECAKMKDWITTELIPQGILKEDDVLMLVSQQSSTQELKPYFDHPEQICKKKVLILTHVRFFSDIIDYFIRYPCPPKDVFDGDFKKLMSGGGTRRYMVFDETPLYLKPFLTLSKGQLSPYADYKGGHWKAKPLHEISDIYDGLIKDDCRMDYYKGNNKLGVIKNQVCLRLISRYFDAVISDKKHKVHPINWYPIQLIQPGMTSWVLVYEGAADVLLGNSKSFKLLDIKQKYNAKISFDSFPFSLEHKVLPSDSDYNAMVAEVEKILGVVSGKTLIVVWKDFTPERSVTVGKGTSSWTKRMTDTLVASGVNPDTFSVTYYGASDSKSTNSYRDYRNIVLVGEWILIPGVTATLKRAYDCDATLEEYMLWYYTQLLCRIGIRNRDGQDYHVYYSDDYDPAFIKKLELYIGHNLWIKKKQSSTPLWELLVSDMCRKQYNERIGKLILYDPMVKEAIEKSSPYTCKISLQDISKIIPMGGKRQRSNYQSLCDFLGKLGVKVVIT